MQMFCFYPQTKSGIFCLQETGGFNQVTRAVELELAANLAGVGFSRNIHFQKSKGSRNMEDCELEAVLDQNQIW